MTFWTFFWIVIILSVIATIFMQMNKSANAENRGTALGRLPDFKPAVMFKGENGGSGVALDPVRNKFAVTTKTSEARIFSFEDLVAVEVLRNGTSIHKTNRGSQVAGAAVGAILLGPVGLLLGGLSGSKRTEEKINQLTLKIFTNDLVHPVYEINFLVVPGLKPDSLIVKQASENLDQWHGRFQTILHMMGK